VDGAESVGRCLTEEAWDQKEVGIVIQRWKKMTPKRPLSERRLRKSQRRAEGMEVLEELLLWYPRLVVKLRPRDV
jgi:hypothetical protein